MLADLSPQAGRGKEALCSNAMALPERGNGWGGDHGAKLITPFRDQRNASLLGGVMAPSFVAPVLPTRKPVNDQDEDHGNDRSQQ
jgi:hypothetical protein